MNASLYPDYVRIGKDCHIHPTVTMGGDGFGLKRDTKGLPVDVKQNEWVVIGNDVRIGEHANIDRGSWRDTKIRDHCRIDVHCHIGHNAVIGEAVFIAAGSIVGGSVNIGEQAYIGMGVTINQRITIGEHAIVGSGSMVIKDVEPYDIVAGNPAKSMKDRSNLTETDRYNMAGY